MTSLFYAHRTLHPFAARWSAFSASAAAAALLAALPAMPAQAQTTLYSNLTTFGGSIYRPQGAVTANRVTKMAADDITVAAGFEGAAVTGFSYTVGNANSATIRAVPTINIYAADGASGGPGTLLTSLTFDASSFLGSAVSLVDYDPGSTIFTVPASGLFWVGETFSSATSGTIATAAQLNNFGLGLLDPPTVGSSADQVFVTTAAGTFASSNPSGSIGGFMGGTPKANFGFAFRGNAAGSAAAPEPGSLALLAPGLLSLAGGIAVRRKKRAA